MHRPNRLRQQGFGLLSLVLATAVVAFSLIVGYSGVLVRAYANSLQQKQRVYLEQVADQLKAVWRSNGYNFDRAGLGNTLTEASLAQQARIVPQFAMQLVVSDVLSIPSEELTYRNVALYIPTNTDGDNPPDVARFKATGEFVSCVDSSRPCEDRAFVVFSSVDIHREALKETRARLTQVAEKAQSYFRARMLQDPERNISVNYFRMPSGACEVLPQDLGCLDVYVPLSTVSEGGSGAPTRAALQLALSPFELVSGWNMPIEASNLLGSEVSEPPYSMSFRALKPYGTYVEVKALQPL